MKKLRNLSKSLSRSIASLSLLGVFTMLALAECKHRGHTSDPRLRQIDEMLDSQLPAGTPKSRVSLYLSSQGIPLKITSDPHDIAAVVHHVNTHTLKPATARRTFHFAAANTLNVNEL